MTDRVYPSSKPNPQPPKTLNGGRAGAPNPSFPATKAQAYGATRPTYRPQPPPKRRPRSRRSCCCACCLWLTLFIVALILLAAIAGGAFYVLYRPHRPSFTVTSLRLSALNVTAADLLTSRLDLSVTARNPNRKISFVYDPSSISVSTNGVQIGSGSFPAFIQGKQNTTVLRSTISSSGQTLDSTTAADLKKKKGTLPLEIEVDTRAGLKIGGLKTGKIGIRVNCVGINAAVPRAKANATASSPDARCKVKLRVKIWKWTV